MFQLTMRPSVVVWSVLLCLLAVEAATAAPAPDVAQDFVYRAGDCVLAATDARALQGIKDVMYDYSLLKIDLLLSNSTTPHIPHLFRPLFWTIATNDPGAMLLNLDECFETFSLGTLSTLVNKSVIEVEQQPHNCMVDKDPNDVEAIMRRFIVDIFNDSANANDTSDSYIQPFKTCNRRIQQGAVYLEVEYFCCWLNSVNEVHCEYLERSIWSHVLVVLIFILKWFISFCVTSFLSKELFYDKRIYRTFTYMFPNNVSLTQTTIKDAATFESLSVQNDIIKVSSRKLDQIDSPINGYNSEPHIIKGVRVKLKEGYLMDKQKQIPTLFVTVAKWMLNYNKRLENAVPKELVDNARWLLRLLKRAMYFLMLIMLLSLPSLRIYMFFQCENNETYREIKIREEQHFKKEPGRDTTTIRENGPGHFTIFMAGVLWILNFFIYSCATKRIRKSLNDIRIIVFKSFLATKRRKKRIIFLWFKDLLLWFGSSYGLPGIIAYCLLATILSPLWITVILCYMLPVTHVCFQGITRFSIYFYPLRFYRVLTIMRRLRDRLRAVDANKKHTDRSLLRRRIVNMLDDNARALEDDLNNITQHMEKYHFIISCVGWAWVGMNSFNLLHIFGECALFFAEMLLYTSVGLIMSSSTALAYFSTVFSIVMYGKRCYGYVRVNFGDCKQTVIEELCSQADEFTTLQKCSIVNKRLSQNTDVLQAAPDFSISSEKNKLRLRVYNCPLYVNHKERVAIDKRLFYRICDHRRKMKTLPGNVLKRFAESTLEFCCVIFFLVCVLLVVLAFGETYNLSPTNQALLSVLGGVLPYFLSTFVFKTPNEIDWEREQLDPLFKAIVRREVDKLHHTFEICGFVYQHEIEEQKERTKYDVAVSLGTRQLRTDLTEIRADVSEPRVEHVVVLDDSSQKPVILSEQCTYHGEIARL